MGRELETIGALRAVIAEAVSGDVPWQQIESSLSAMSFDDLRVALVELRGAIDRNPSDGGVGDLQRLVVDVQQRLLELSNDRDRDRISRPLNGEDKSDEPARRRVLGVLRLGPDTPTRLAAKLDLAVPTVSRILTALATAGQVSSVKDPDDGRRRVYHVEESGLAALQTAERVLGAAPPPAVLADETRSYLSSALRLAIQMRREDHDLEAATERMRAVVRRSRDENLPALEVFARKELITTLRQARDWDGVRAELDRLSPIAIDGARTSEVVLQASAHLKYELGRLADERTLADRAVDLTSAIADFELLRERPRPAELAPDAEDWVLRNGWAVAGLADNLREQTEFGKAIDQANAALALFDSQDDHYGQARCHFLRGFCLRLRGLYTQATPALTTALDLCKANGYTRWEADSLLQLGDVARCEQDPDTAIKLLDRSLVICEDLGLIVTTAFATSAKGAALSDLGDYSRAHRLFEQSQALFDQAGHSQGSALNRRRAAVVSRHLGDAETSLKMNTTSFAEYKDLSSPAGVMACLVGIGEGLSALGLSTTKLSELMRLYLLQPTPRRLIELDPCTPQLVLRFAENTDDSDLVKEADCLVREARAVLAENPEDDDVLLSAVGDPTGMSPSTQGLNGWDWPRVPFSGTDVFSIDNEMGIEPRFDAGRRRFA